MQLKKNLALICSAVLAIMLLQTGTTSAVGHRYVIEDGKAKLIEVDDNDPRNLERGGVVPRNHTWNKRVWQQLSFANASGVTNRVTNENGSQRSATANAFPQRTRISGSPSGEGITFNRIADPTNNGITLRAAFDVVDSGDVSVKTRYLPQNNDDLDSQRTINLDSIPSSGAVTIIYIKVTEKDVHAELVKVVRQVNEVVSAIEDFTKKCNNGLPDKTAQEKLLANRLDGAHIQLFVALRPYGGPTAAPFSSFDVLVPAPATHEGWIGYKVRPDMLLHGTITYSEWATRYRFKMYQLEKACMDLNLPSLALQVIKNRESVPRSVCDLAAPPLWDSGFYKVSGSGFHYHTVNSEEILAGNSKTLQMS
ncbi:hypothetical protein FACS1894198_0810 [Clostridia bacterium]|nr:hypothetical protein FACS1894198_0810 [Clostridia bacterium]